MPPIPNLRTARSFQTLDSTHTYARSLKITVYCSNESHEFYGKLSDLSEMKILKNFLMIHKSFYINIAHISSYSYDSLTIDDCRELPISKPNRKEVRRAILKYSADRFRETCK